MNEKILVVDDDRDFLLLLTYELEQQGYRIITAANGEEGFEKARSEKPDMIITDVMMPGMTGFTLVKELRKDSHTQDIPVIAYTGAANITEKDAPQENNVKFLLKSKTFFADIEAKIFEILEEKKRKGEG